MDYDILEKELRKAIGQSQQKLGEKFESSPEAITETRNYEPIGISGMFSEKKEPVDSPAVETQSLPSEPSAISADEQPTREPSSMQMSDMDALLVGATPLLAGLLTGNMQDAYSASSSGLMTLAQWRMAKEKKKTESESSRNRYYIDQVEMPDGTVKLARVDKQTGEITPTEYTAGFKQGIIKDPRTEELVRASGGRGMISPLKDTTGEAPQQLKVRQQRLLRSTRDQMKTDKALGVAKTAFNSANQIITTLQSGNPIGEVGTKILFPRMFGEVGNLTAQEQAAFQSNPQLLERGRQAYSRYLEGKPFTDQNKSDLIELARLMRDANKQVMEGIITGYAEQEGPLSGISAKEAKEILMKNALPDLNTVGVVKGLKGKKEAGQIMKLRNRKTGKIETYKVDLDGMLEKVKK